MPLSPASRRTSCSENHGWSASRRKPAAPQYTPSATNAARSSSPMPYSACDRCRALRDRSPWVARLVAPAPRPLRARNDHLLTSSITNSCSASHDPEQIVLRFRLLVNSTVPGSTLCQQLRSNGTTRRTASSTAVANATQSRPSPARPRISSPRRRTTSTPTAAS
jgi:hypothetical protein